MEPNQVDYDAIIVGGGPIGLSTAYHIAKSGKKVLLLEKYYFFNQSGSSGDLVRMYRTMYTEDYMADLAHQSLTNWQQLAADSGESNLLLMSGLLNFGNPKYDLGPEGTLLAPKANLDRLKMSYKELTKDEIEAQFPFKNLPDDYVGIWAPDNGCINVPLLLRTLYRLGQSYGATMKQEASVDKIITTDNGVEVQYVDKQGKRISVKGKKAVLTSGAYTNHVLTQSFNFRLKLDIWEMVYGYYATNPGPEGTQFRSMWFQFENDSKESYILGFSFEYEGEYSIIIRGPDGKELVRQTVNPSESPAHSKALQTDEEARKLTLTAAADKFFREDFNGGDQPSAAKKVSPTLFTVRVLVPAGVNLKDLKPEVKAPNGQIVDGVTLEVDEAAPQKQLSNLYYGFPTVPWGPPNMVRIAVDAAVRRITDPNQRRIDPAPEDIERTSQFVKERLPGVNPTAVFMGSCLMTNVEDNMFILDYLPADLVKHGNKNVVVMTAGWAMKFVPLLGDCIKQMLYNEDGKTTYNIDHFKMTRENNKYIESVVQTPQPNLLKSPSEERSNYSGSGQHRQTEEKNAFLTANTALLASSVSAAPTSSYSSFLPIDVKSQYALRVLRKVEKKIVQRSQVRDENPSSKLKIGIIGAGSAGMYAALLLRDIGVDADVEVMEANPDRIGGRMYTYHFDQKKDGNGNQEKPKKGTAEYYNYFDAGAMRFPEIDSMYRVIGKPSLTDEEQKNVRKLRRYPSLVDYLNEQMVDKSNLLELKPYYLGPKDGKNNIIYYNGQRIYSQDDPVQGDPLKFSNANNNGRGVPDCFVAKGYSKILDEAYDEFKQKLAEKDKFSEGFKFLLENDDYSTRAYLRKCVNVPESVVSWCETLDSSTGLYDMAFVESVIDSFDFDNPGGGPWFLIDGGTSRLAEELYNNIKDQKNVTITKNCKVTKIEPVKLGSGLQVFTSQSTTQPKHFDHVINTVPLSVMRSMDLKDCNLSLRKRTAIRSLRYDYSVKVAIKFEKRWWEDATFMKNKQFQGGVSSCDLPIRTVVYPSYGMDCKDAPGILIVSYTWAQDAMRIGAFSNDQDLVAMCMKDLAELHDIKEEDLQALRTGDNDYKVMDWNREPNQHGAFALFGPAQFTSLFPDMIEPEAGGLLHFAGEATSVHHAWIVGGLNSAYRSVLEILYYEKMYDKRDELIKKWGIVDEIDYSQFGLHGLEQEKRYSLKTNHSSLYASVARHGAHERACTMAVGTTPYGGYTAGTVARSIVTPNRM